MGRIFTRKAGNCRAKPGQSSYAFRSKPLKWAERTEMMSEKLRYRLEKGGGASIATTFWWPNPSASHSHIFFSHPRFFDLFCLDEPRSTRAEQVLDDRKSLSFMGLNALKPQLPPPTGQILAGSKRLFRAISFGGFCVKCLPHRGMFA